jgi:phosphatidylglycerol phospholipase C
MQHVRTRKEPRQPIPTFAETIELLMKASSGSRTSPRSPDSDTPGLVFFQPENHHVKFNVDVKVQNDPDRLFSLMNEIIAAQPDWQTALAPRILLGLWHPRFLDHAKARLPYCRRSYIGCSTDIARKYFWNDCDAFSIAFGALAAYDGQRYAFELSGG